VESSLLFLKKLRNQVLKTELKTNIFRTILFSINQFFKNWVLTYSTKTVYSIKKSLPIHRVRISVIAHGR
jgi:uncharacterized membrane protein (DUF485 family)